MRSKWMRWSLAIYSLLVVACSHRGGDAQSPGEASPVAPLTAQVGDAGHQAGTETQNGGYGVKAGDKIVSLDLFLRGSDALPYLSQNVRPNLTASEESIVREKLKDLRPSVVDLVIRKLSDVRSRAEQLKLGLPVAFMIENMQNFTWLVLQNTSCLDVGDDSSPIAGKVQLAYRQSSWIRFCREAPALEDPHLAALAIHEIAYASLWRKSLTQEFVGLIFSPDFRELREPAANEFRLIVQALNSVSKSKVANAPTNHDDEYFAAIQDNDLARVRAFVAQGRRPDERHNRGVSAIRLALDFRSAEVFDLLVRAGGQVDEAMFEGAIASGFNQAVLTMLQSGQVMVANSNRHWVYFAVLSHNPRAIDLLAQAGAEVNHGWGESPMVRAIRDDDLASVHALLQLKSTRLDQPDGYNCSYLSTAVSESGSVEIIAELMAAGFDINAKCGPGPNAGLTPLQVLSNNFFPLYGRGAAVAELLIAKGATVHFAPGQGLLDLAIGKNEEMALYYIKIGLDNEIVGPEGTPLMKAVAARSPKLVKALLESGVNVNARFQQKTALGLAHQMVESYGRSQNENECIDLIIKAGGVD